MDTVAKKKTETVEDIVLRYSRRGMHILREHLDENFCRLAAERMLTLKKGNILLTTGFYVDGHAETDGPLGTMTLANALRKVGYHPLIITALFCRGLFAMEGPDVTSMDIKDGWKEYGSLIREYDPVGMISIERCGRNTESDYVNMRGDSIKSRTARIDLLFELAMEHKIPTFGIGDGGNEIGMGNLKEVIQEELSLAPCEVTVDTLVISTVSNWGAYAVEAYMQQMKNVRLLPSYKEIKRYLETIVNMGSVDGVTGRQSASVDGFPLEVEREILESLDVAASAADAGEARKAG